MRERLDCAVLLTRCTFDWIQPMLGQHSGGRLHVHPLDTVVTVTDPGAPAALGSAAMSLRRYDVCLLPVMPATLSWARTTLSLAVSELRTPVMALTRDLSTAGLYDLHELGVADFLRVPFCPNEARMRVERLLDSRRDACAHLAAVRHQVADGGAEHVHYGSQQPAEAWCRDSLNDGADVEAYALTAASRCAGDSEPFREAKSRMIERFERAYITAALGRHGGNIAMAARSAQKHRRAFWAIMRKHQISAEPFREPSEQQPPQGGQPCAAGAKGSPSERRPAAFLAVPARARPYNRRGG